MQAMSLDRPKVLGRALKTQRVDPACIVKAVQRQPSPQFASGTQPLAGLTVGQDDRVYQRIGSSVIERPLFPLGAEHGQRP